MHSGRSMSESAPGHRNDHQQVSRPHRFFSEIPRPIDSMFTNRVSSSGLVVIVLTKAGSGGGLAMLWATIRPPGRTRGSSLVRNRDIPACRRR